MIPIRFTWDGESMIPDARSRLACDRQFAVGEVYPLIPQEARSRESHNHYFASVEEAWRNLPEDVAERFATSEHLRKYALIKAGFYDEHSIVCASKAEAQRMASFIKPIDEFSIVLAREATVIRFSAKSQSQKAMGKKVFQGSKQAVLDILASMIGVAPAQLEQEAGKAA